MPGPIFSPENLAKASSGVTLSADPQQQPAHINSFYKAFPAIGQGADLATTLYGLTHGYHEENPIFGGNTGALVGSKLAAALLGSYLTHKLEPAHPQAAKTVSLITGLSGAIPAGINTINFAKR